MKNVKKCTFAHSTCRLQKRLSKKCVGKELEKLVEDPILVIMNMFEGHVRSRVSNQIFHGLKPGMAPTMFKMFLETIIDRWYKIDKKLASQLLLVHN